MAKFGKFLFFSAVAGAAGAAAYYYLKEQNYQFARQSEEDDDFDDFAEEDLDDDVTERSYVTLTPEKVQQTVIKAAGEAKEVAQVAFEGAKAIFQEAKESLTAKDEDNFYSNVKETAANAMDAAADLAKDVAEKADDTVDLFGNEAKETAEQVKDQVEEFFDDADDEN
ncbi:MAG: hypothetical protein K6G23_01230 [Lachnospiraceae bacterium]|nr:hypothetical protein [Lachnospiraceae bacterium]